MSQPETAVAWRLFSYNWVLIGLMGLVCVVAVPLAGFSVKATSLIWPITVCGAYTLFAYYKRHKESDPLVVFVLGSTGQILLIPLFMTPLTYVAATFNLPFKDVGLNAIDQTLGLDWFSYFKFIYGHHALLVCAVWSYAMINWQTFGVPVMLGIAHRYQRLQEFTLAFGLALIITTFISIFVPAMGTYDLLNYLPDPEIFTPSAYVDYLRVQPLIRAGHLRELDLWSLIGIVTFPSFHAATAVLYLWAFWGVKWFRLIAAPMNGAMILATPLVGGHYFIDVFAGIAVAVVSILLARQIAELVLSVSGSELISTSRTTGPVVGASRD